MAFENIDVDALTNAISNYKSTMEYNKTMRIKNEILNEQIGHAPSKENLSKALDELINVKYKKLEDRLDLCSNVALMLKKYKELELKIKEKEKEIEDLSGQLNRELDEIETNAIKEKIAMLESSLKYSRSELTEMEAQINSMI